MTVSVAPRPATSGRWAAAPRTSRGALWWSVAIYTASTVCESALPSGSLGRVSRLTALILIVVVLHGRLHPVRSRNTASAALAVIALLAAASGIWSIDQATSTSRAFTFAALAATGLALAEAIRRLGGLTAVVSGLQGGALVAAGIVLVTRATGQFVSTTAYEDLSQRSSAGRADPNDIALALVLVASVCLFGPAKAIWKVASMVMIIAAFFTGSRGALVALAAGVAVAFGSMLLMDRERRVRRVVGALVALFVGGLIAWKTLPPALTDRLANINSDLTSGSFTGRDVLWAGAVHQVQQTPLLGTGAGTAHLDIYAWTGIDLVTHDVHLSFLVELGLAGWIPFLVALASAGLGAARGRQRYPWMLPVWVVLFVGTLALSWEYNKLMWVLLIAMSSVAIGSGSTVAEARHEG